MTARFQIVHFEPDPFSGSRFAVGALVENGASVQLVTGWVPGPRCLGGDQASALVRMLLESLRTCRRLGELPMSAGPQVQIAPVQSVPGGVADPASWVRDHVLPQRPAREDDLGESAPFAPRRETAGFRFFETWNVAQWVKKKYRPPAVPEWARPDLAPDISHYVPGTSRLLLMEPLVTTREAFEKDLEQVGQTFLAWRGLQRYMQLPQEQTLITYIHGGAQDRVAEARRALKHVDRVFDVDEPGDRGEFLALIRQVGATGLGAPLL